MQLKYFEVSFDNFEGECISCDVSILPQTVASFNHCSIDELTLADFDYWFRFFFRLRRPDDEFVALIPIIDDNYDTSKAISSHLFFMQPKSWY